MKNNAKEAEKLTEILKKADSHPMVKKILEEEAEATLKKRQEATEKIKNLKMEKNKILPELQKALLEKEKKYFEAKTSLDSAAIELNKSKAALFGEDNRISYAIDQQEASLLETAAPEINEAIEFFNVKLSWLRKPGRISRDARGSIRNIFTMKKDVKEETNLPAVLSAMQYCQQAIKMLGKLKLEADFDQEKIDLMKAEIPGIDTFTKTTVEKPLPGSKGFNPLHLLPSDSEMDWKKGKLMEKAKKILKR